MMKTLSLLFLLLVLAGCGAREQTKRYPMQGDVKALDPVSKTATVDAGKIDDWMDAMVMDYPVKPDSEFAKLHVGDHIEATVAVTGTVYYLTDVKVAPKK